MWLSISIAMLFMTLNSQLLTVVANVLDIDYPPVLLLIRAIIFLLFFVLYVTFELSQLRKEC